MSKRAIWLRGGAAILAGAVLAGCALIRGGGPPGASQIPHPSGDDLVLGIYDTGGFVPADYLLTALPAFTLLGDGRVIVTGPTTLVYPGAALPNLLVRRLNERGIQSVLEAAERSGQLAVDASWTGANLHVADASDTVFVLHAGGREVTVRVYALGIVDAGMPDVTDAERDAHGALGQLRADLLDLDSWIGSAGWEDAEWQPYRADALRLIVRAADGEVPGPNEVPFNELPWPAGVTGPETFGDPVFGGSHRCGVATGPEAADWYEALAGANQLTRWTEAGHRYVVSARPLLPDEPRDCAPLA